MSGINCFAESEIQSNINSIIQSYEDKSKLVGFDERLECLDTLISNLLSLLRVIHKNSLLYNQVESYVTTFCIHLKEDMSIEYSKQHNVNLAQITMNEIVKRLESSQLNKVNSDDNQKRCVNHLIDFVRILKTYMDIFHDDRPIYLYLQSKMKYYFPDLVNAIRCSYLTEIAERIIEGIFIEFNPYLMDKEDEREPTEFLFQETSSVTMT